MSVKNLIRFYECVQELEQFYVEDHVGDDDELYQKAYTVFDNVGIVAYGRCHSSAVLNEHLVESVTLFVPLVTARIFVHLNSNWVTGNWPTNRVLQLLELNQVGQLYTDDVVERT